MIYCLPLDLAGKTDLEQAQVDMFIDCFEDATKPMLTFFFEKDEAKKVQLNFTICMDVAYYI